MSGSSQRHGAAPRRGRQGSPAGSPHRPPCASSTVSPARTLPSFSRKSPAASLERRWGEGGGEQDDAEIGVVADGCRGRLDGCADARPDREHRPGDRRRRDARACSRNRRRSCAGRVAEAMHIAGLQRVELGQAGIMEGLGDLRCCEDAPHAPSWPRGARVRRPEARRRGRARRSDRRCASRVTRCKPCQAGMLFTSSTRSCPSRSCMISTPA